MTGEEAKRVVLVTGTEKPSSSLSAHAIAFLRSAANVANAERGRYFGRPDELLTVALRDASAKVDGDDRFWLSEEEAVAVKALLEEHFTDRSMSAEEVSNELRVLAEEAAR